MCLWIGGPPASGKTTVARIIARRWGIRWYNADARTWEHRDRAIAAGNPAAIRWERMTIAERWSAPPDDMMAMSLHRERGAMIAADLRGLPEAPLTIAEGTPVTPAVAGTGRRSVWLLPTAEVQQARLERRNQPAAVHAWNRLLTREILNEVVGSGAYTVLADGRPVEQIVAEVEALFEEALAAGPTATSVHERRVLLRWANQAIVSQHLAGLARPWSTGDARGTVRSFACECGRADCGAQVDLPVAGFPDTPIIAH
jgi:hypothetical protein